MQLRAASARVRLRAEILPMLSANFRGLEPHAQLTSMSRNVQAARRGWSAPNARHPPASIGAKRWLPLTGERQRPLANGATTPRRYRQPLRLYRRRAPSKPPRGHARDHLSQAHGAPEYRTRIPWSMIHVPTTQLVFASLRLVEVLTALQSAFFAETSRQ